jgi:hypothetical protein
VGFARSLLGYRLPDGRIQLIDGHLRREFDPNMEVTVEVLDVTEEEARKLLLTVDPLGTLAETDAAVVSQLAEMTRADNETLNDLWRSLSEASEKVKSFTPKPQPQETTEKFMVLVECKNEQEQLALLRRFKQEGLTCKALIS